MQVVGVCDQRPIVPGAPVPWWVDLSEMDGTASTLSHGTGTPKMAVLADAQLDLEDDDEVGYVARKYAVTPRRVREAASVVGTTLSAIEEVLSRIDSPE